MAFEIYLLYLAAVGVFFASPPDTSQLLIVSNSIKYGLKRSAFTMAGDLTANCIQMTCAAFGLAAVIATSASAFVWIKWIGVVYLGWIGLQLFRSKETPLSVEASMSGTSARLFRQGFITSMANPFCRGFFSGRCFHNSSTQHRRCCRSSLFSAAPISLSMARS